MLTLEKIDTVKARQLRMFRDQEQLFWEDVLDEIDDSFEDKFRTVGMLYMRFILKFKEEWIARAFGIDIANVSRTLAKGVRVLRDTDVEVLCRNLMTVTVPVEVLEKLVEHGRDSVDPVVERAVRAGLNALEANEAVADDLDEFAIAE